MAGRVNLSTESSVLDQLVIAAVNAVVEAVEKKVTQVWERIGLVKSTPESYHPPIELPER